MTLPHERAPEGAAATFAARLAALLPEIETERLRLRAPRIGDFPLYAECLGGPAARFVFDETPERRDLWLDFVQTVSIWLLRGHGLWTVEPRAGGEPLGFALIGFEDGDHEPELGYFLRPEAEGKGYATEAAGAALAHAFGPLGLPALVSTIDHENTRSQRLAERLGGARDAAAEAAHGGRIRVYRYRRAA